MITASSLIFGLIAMNAASESNFVMASWLIALSILCDGLDGKVARLLNASTKFGAELDTLSDFVVFGVVPGFIAYKSALYHYGYLGGAISIIYVLSGAYRLVRFNLKNISLSDKKPFEGLPIPTGAALIVSFIILFEKYNTHLSFIPFIPAIFAITLIASFLMTSRLEFLCPESPNKKGNKAIYSKIGILLFILFTIKYTCLSFFLVTYSYSILGYFRAIVKRLYNKEDSVSDVQFVSENENTK